MLGISRAIIKPLPSLESGGVPKIKEINGRRIKNRIPQVKFNSSFHKRFGE